MSPTRTDRAGAIHLKCADLEAIRQHGEEAYPNECCGLLLGTLEPGPAPPAKLIRSVERLENEREESRHNRFLITPETFLRVDRAARARGLEILGFYHSHPDHPARPSEFDREHAWPVYSYIIVSVTDGVSRELNSWVLASDRGRFESETIVPALED
jgi:proteasome lid subunit RPN8/RPN11